jgi:hypothetical protein
MTQGPARVDEKWVLETGRDLSDKEMIPPHRIQGAG